MVAHNMVNLLSAIIGYCDLLSEKIEQGSEAARHNSRVSGLHSQRANRTSKESGGGEPEGWVSNKRHSCCGSAFIFGLRHSYSTTVQAASFCGDGKRELPPETSVIDLAELRPRIMPSTPE
jgi:hypothetical protein